MIGPKQVHTTLKLLILALFLTLVSIYLFVSAPPSLQASSSTGTIDVELLLKIVQHENSTARSLYTERIVKPGQIVGLNFDDDWKRSPDVGPLPASFLRQTSFALEALPVPLSLFIGSDKPINDANRFEGTQIVNYQELVKTRNAQFFYSKDVKRHIGMFPDVAVNSECVDCHNNDERSPYRSWKQGDVMGAVSWAYPNAQVSQQEALRAIAALRQAIYASFDKFLDRTREFSNAPQIGDRWPSDGYYLPSTKDFAQEHQRRASQETLALLLGKSG